MIHLSLILINKGRGDPTGRPYLDGQDRQWYRI